MKAGRCLFSSSVLLQKGVIKNNIIGEVPKSVQKTETHYCLSYQVLIVTLDARVILIFMRGDMLNPLRNVFMCPILSVFVTYWRLPRVDSLGLLIERQPVDNASKFRCRTSFKARPGYFGRHLRHTGISHPEIRDIRLHRFGWVRRWRSLHLWPLLNETLSWPF